MVLPVDRALKFIAGGTLSNAVFDFILHVRPIRRISGLSGT